EQEKSISRYAGAVGWFSHLQYSIANAHLSMWDLAPVLNHHQFFGPEGAFQEIDISARARRMHVRQYAPPSGRCRTKPRSDVPVVPEGILHERCAFAVRTIRGLSHLAHQSDRTSTKGPAVGGIAIVDIHMQRGW